MHPDCDPAAAVRTFAAVTGTDPFADLYGSVRFEALGPGREGAVLVAGDGTGGAFVVRTTTRYASPAQWFGHAHERLARRIEARAALAVRFNNALVEAYTSGYATMAAHSDQALDLAGDSCIAVYSCYEDPRSAAAPRVLLVEPKGPGGRAVEVPLAHDTAVVFSVGANRRLRHRIVLRGGARGAENRWLGVTLRTSRTVVRYRDGGAYLPDGTQLALADEDQRHAFYRLRGRENREVDFEYPRVPFTLSESDLVPPERAPDPPPPAAGD